MTKPYLTLSTYFPLLNEFEHSDLLTGVDPLWEIILKNGDYTQQLISQARMNTAPTVIEGMEIFVRHTPFSEIMVHVRELIEIEQLTVLDAADIVFEPGVTIEPGAVIKGPAYIGANTQILQGAYLRGNVITGTACVIGHCTEVKNSVIMNHTAAAHFAYIGDSVIGSHVNFGAGTRLANLQFRKGAEKENNIFPPMTLVLDQQRISVEQSKMGSFIGDYCEIGCNAVLNPGVFLSANCCVYPNTTVKKGYYSPESFING